MTVLFSASDIIDLTGARIISGDPGDAVGAIRTDVHDVAPGDWFLALPGKRSDGHDMLSIAQQRGALGCIVVDGRRYPFSRKDATLLGVTSTLQTYYSLARYIRALINPTVVAITGSSGKSTCRDMLASILAVRFRTCKSSASPSDARSIARTIFSMPSDTEVLVAELSQRGRGQIAWLASILKPQVAIITNIGYAHLETLGSLDNIAAAKCEVLEALSLSYGTGIIGQNEPVLLDRAGAVFDGGQVIVGEDGDIDEIAVTPETTVFAVQGSDARFELRAHGSGYLKDAWCAIMCARELNLPDDVIAEGLRHYDPPHGRGNRIQCASGALVIDESYSATPDSIRAAVTAFLDKRAVPASKKYIVIGEVQELGEASAGLHASLGKWLRERQFDGLLTIGDNARYTAHALDNCANDGEACARVESVICSTAAEAASWLLPRLRPDVAVLVDGSDSPELRALLHTLATGFVSNHAQSPSPAPERPSDLRQG